MPIRASLCGMVLLAANVASQPAVSASAETQRIRASSVTAASGGGWNVVLTMDDDNGNASLPSSYRRWWHVQIGNLAAGGERLVVQVTNAGYADVILPVWSLSGDGGASFGAWSRVPAGATPVVNGTTHTFTLQTPPGTTALRLAKYFPYGVADRDRFLARVATHPKVRRVTSLGTTRQGRALRLLELSDPAVPDGGKRRVWIHAGIHPAETTGYFTVEGLVEYLLSGEPAAEVLLAGAIVQVVPMANPDGVALGNYRTNANSVNLEDEWAAPYASSEPEIVALRTAIEQALGTPTAKAPQPIAVVLNLHSSHNVAYPFHFQHSANAAFDLQSNRSGVIPPVNVLEGQWIAALRARSAFVARGATQSSTCGAPARPFVECMAHDRWSIDPAWTAPPNPAARLMAITLEGTYGRGPDGVNWNTPSDYQRLGRELALALGDYLALLPGATLRAYGASCGGMLMTGSLNRVAGALRLDLAVRQAPVTPLAALVVGAQGAALPLPPSTCLLLTDPWIVLPLGLDAQGAADVALPLPPLPALLAHFQALAALDQGGAPAWRASAGLRLDAAR